MKKTKSLFIAIITLLTLAVFSQAQHPPQLNTVNLNLTADQWRQDLRYFAEELPKKHTNAFHLMTREQFETAVKRLNDDIPNLKSEEVFVRFLNIIAMVGDGHTSIEEQSLFAFGIYPLRYEIYKEGVFIQSSSPDYGEIVGGKVTKIGNIPIEKVMSQINEISWGDNYNEQSKKVESSFLINIPKILQGLKIAESDQSVTLTVEVGGQQKIVEVKVKKDLQNFDGNQVNAFDRATNPLPLYLKNHQSYYWSEYLPDTKTFYIQFNRNLNNANGDSVETFFEKSFDFVERNSVDKVVLDLRTNTGGNLLLNKPITIGLIKSKLNERGKLFVIIGRRTFSAAQNLVNELEKYTNAIFIGEPTGSSPNLFGDPAIMTLPNSKLPFRVSTLLWQPNPTDKRTFTAPEIYAAITPDDYRNNRDPAMDAVLNYIPGTTFKDLTAKAAANSDIPAFIKKYRAFKSNPANQYINTATDINTLGYRLLREKKNAEAIEIFKLNVEAYPDAANGYDSLAEGYLVSGNKEEAIKNYEKAVSINPNFTASIEALKRLKN